MTNEKSQYIFYNKVAGVVVTGIDDGAEHASASILNVAYFKSVLRSCRM